MNKNSRLIKIKYKLMNRKIGKIILKIYHYIVSVPLVKMNSLRFYFIKDKIKPIEFYSMEDTFNMLTFQNVSLCRFGDGEISWIYRDSKGYFGQENSEELSRRLKEVFNSNSEGVLIGIPDFFGSMEQYSKKRIQSRNAHLAKYYKRWMDLVNEDNRYVDALITRVYNGRKSNDSELIFRKWKEVWKGKNVVIIEGNKTRFGVGNDLLRSAQSIKRIIAPAENAFKKYEQIYKITKKYFDNDVLFLIALGPTATVLAYDLGKEGYQAIDIGHLDIEYEWYLSGASKKEAIAGKYVNEVGGAPRIEIEEEKLIKYNSEIVDYI